jgi:hypothetical protein
MKLELLYQNMDDINIETNGKSFKIISFNPSENKERALEFHKGHRDVLKTYGLESISSNENWVHLEGITCYAVLNRHNAIICGLRIQSRSENALLPVEQALRNKSKRITPYLEELESLGKTAEMCGLWVSHNYTKLNLPMMLSQFACDQTKNTDIEYC